MEGSLISEGMSSNEHHRSNKTYLEKSVIKSRQVLTPYRFGYIKELTRLVSDDILMKVV